MTEDCHKSRPSNKSLIRLELIGRLAAKAAASARATKSRIAPGERSRLRIIWRDHAFGNLQAGGRRTASPPGPSTAHRRAPKAGKPAARAPGTPDRASDSWKACGHSAGGTCAVSRSGAPRSSKAKSGASATPAATFSTTNGPLGNIALEIGRVQNAGAGALRPHRRQMGFAASRRTVKRRRRRGPTRIGIHERRPRAHCAGATMKSPRPSALRVSSGRTSWVTRPGFPKTGRAGKYRHRRRPTARRTIRSPRPRPRPGAAPPHQTTEAAAR